MSRKRRQQVIHSGSSHPDSAELKRRYRKRIAIIGAFGGAIAFLGWIAQNIPKDSPDLDRHARDIALCTNAPATMKDGKGSLRYRSSCLRGFSDRA